MPMTIEKIRKTVGDRLLLLLIALLFVAYMSLGLLGLSNQFVPGQRITLCSMILSAPVVVFIGTRLLLRLRWSDAASLAINEIYYSPFAIGVFYGARNVLWWHWSIAVLLAFPAFAMMLGVIYTASKSKTPAALEAIARSNQVISGIEIGSIHEGKVAKLFKFGAAISIAPGVRGLLHISQISDKGAKKISDALKEGETVRVKVLEIDDWHHIQLSQTL